MGKDFSRMTEVFAHASFSVIPSGNLLL